MGDNSLRRIGFGHVLMSSIDVAFIEKDVYSKSSPARVACNVSTYHPARLAPAHLEEIMQNAERQTIPEVGTIGPSASSQHFLFSCSVCF